jgi:predicted AAA+ superfamily ATPase
MVKAPKLYFLDTGLSAWLLNWTIPETLEAGPLSGAFFETWVISEIYKSFLNAGMEPSLYYYRDKDKKDIDLLIYIDRKLHPVEIKKTAAPDRAMVRNFQVLEKAERTAEEESPLSPAPAIGSGALICQIPQYLPINEHHAYVPVGFL